MKVIHLSILAGKGIMVLIMMWGGHVALVTAVLDGKVYFATMDRSGAAIGSVKLDSNCFLLTESTWGSGGFLGLWTPD